MSPKSKSAIIIAVGIVVSVVICYMVWIEPLMRVRELMDDAFIELYPKKSSYLLGKAMIIVDRVKDRYAILLDRAYEKAIDLRDQLASAGILAKKNYIKDAVNMKIIAYIKLEDLLNTVLTSPIFILAHIAIMTPFIIASYRVIKHARKINRNTPVQKLQTSNENTSGNRGL